MQAISEVPAYVICLEKKRKTRCDQNFVSIQQIFPGAVWTPAVDADTIKDDDERISTYAKYHIRTKVDTDYIHLASKGAVGCALSHIQLWQKIANSKKAAIIVEDDMYLTEKKQQEVKKAYKQIPADANYASIIHLPWPASNIHKTDTDYKKIQTREMISGTQMYYLTPKGAEILLKDAFPIVTHVDVYISYMAVVYPDLNAVFYTGSLYPFIEFIKDDLYSSIRHKPYIKKMLPESNVFYICFLSVFFIMFILIIVFLHRLRRK